MIDLAHFADLQLGFDYGPNGRSVQRARDFEMCFNAVIAECQERKPKVILFVGDIWHRPSPSKRDLMTFQSGLLRLQLADETYFPTVIVVSGNHETPKSTKDIHPFRLFEHIDNTFMVWEESMMIGTEIGGVWAVPWKWGEPLADEDFDVDNKNDLILACHAPCLEVLPPEAHAGQVRIIDLEEAAKFRYAALGDFHDFCRMGERRNIVYPGSLDRTSFGEARSTTGGVFIRFNGREGALDRWESPARPMFTPTVELHGRENPEKILRAALGVLPDDALVRLTVKGADPKMVDTGSLVQEFPFVKFKWEDTPAPPVLSSFSPGKVEETWKMFVEENSLSEKVSLLGSEALQAGAEQ